MKPSPVKRKSSNPKSTSTRTSPNRKNAQNDEFLQYEKTINEATEKNNLQGAFTQTATQMVGIALAMILYFNYVMIKPYLTPIFWALACGVVLWEPKRKMVECLADLAMNGIRSKSYSIWYIYWKRVECLYRKFMYLNPFLPLIALAAFTAGYFYLKFNIPFLFVLAVPLCSGFLIFLVLIFLDPSYHDALVASLLVTAIPTVFFVSGHFFLAMSFEEGRAFAMEIDVQNILQKLTLTEEQFADVLAPCGITVEMIETQIDESKIWTVNWIQHNIGLNITELEDIYFTFSGSRNKSNPIIDRTTWNSIEFFDMVGTPFSKILRLWISEFDINRIWPVAGFFSYFARFFWIAGYLIKSVYGFALSFIVFEICLYYLLQSKTFFLDQVLHVLPVTSGLRDHVKSTLIASVNGVLLGSLAICLSHAGITYATFKFILGLDFVYLSTFVTAVTALFPFVSSWIVIPPVLAIHYLRGNSIVISSVVLFVVQMFFWVIDSRIYEMIPKTHPYITGVSIVLGIATFGAEGILIGPMLIVFTVTGYHLFDENVHVADEKKDL
eukprot:TRINITY_DN10067_c0_g1_i1.p1 TRINITY_DN10067_c0_g1~~TRINITY_DN10067_c0_g1_i1.p1  ORF type:complete len:554 (+),score=66.56 TRINITY_DN10067_c0_g1_i1:30-1691(+)